MENELLKTLKWYEAILALVNRHDSEGERARNILAQDCGRKAREVISQYNKEIENE